MFEFDDSTTEAVFYASVTIVTLLIITIRVYFIYLRPEQPGSVLAAAPVSRAQPTTSSPTPGAVTPISEEDAPAAREVRGGNLYITQRRGDAHVLTVHFARRWDRGLTLSMHPTTADPPPSFDALARLEVHPDHATLVWSALGAHRRAALTALVHGGATLDLDAFGLVVTIPASPSAPVSVEDATRVCEDLIDAMAPQTLATAASAPALHMPSSARVLTYLESALAFDREGEQALLGKWEDVRVRVGLAPDPLATLPPIPPRHAPSPIGPIYLSVEAKTGCSVAPRAARLYDPEMSPFDQRYVYITGRPSVDRQAALIELYDAGVCVVVSDACVDARLEGPIFTVARLDWIIERIHSVAFDVRGEEPYDGKTIHEERAT